MKTQIIAHRGASKYAPENTMPAFQLAYEMGADGIETDVRLTKDNIPVLIHDADLKRTTNYSGLVKDNTLESIKKVDAGQYFSNNYKETKIPSLEEFLAWAINKDIHLHLELKDNPSIHNKFEQIVLDIIQKYQMQSKITFSSFNKLNITKLRGINTTTDIALLTSKNDNKLPDTARALGANALHLKYNLLHDKLVKQMTIKKIPYRVYTVNRPSSIKRSLRYRCDGIITDVPDIALALRNKFTD